MKKFLPYILILVIIANIFAPFNVLIGQKNVVRVEQNIAEADSGIMFRAPEYLVSDTYVRIRYKIEFAENGGLTREKLLIVWSDPNETDESKKIIDSYQHNNLKVTGKVTASNGSTTTLVEDTILISGLTPDKEYEFSATLVQSDYGDLLTKVPVVSVYNYFFGDKNDPIWGYDVTVLDSNTDRIRTNKEGVKGEVSIRGQATANEEAFLPECALIKGSQGFLGCFAQLFYYALFVPTAFLFGLAGKFFDWTFAYSIIDTSYRSSFVTEGWSIVRDVCNLFFIFVLIYAAFGMILSIHSIKAKEILINTILIGLLINFSLFAGQVMIDTSNILARVFYNSEAISISVNGSGQASKGGINTTQNTEIGELSLSAALVGKINPQRIIIESSNVNVRDDVTGKSGTATDTTQKMGAGSFFLVVLLAIAVNVTGMIVFLSVGLIFIARVIGLWFSLIFAPLAFFSYTVPQMQSMPMLGWKKWWPETIGLCFVAPIFMFFMYLILLFLNTGFAGIMAEQSGPNWVLSIIIPFVFIIMLLLTAKKLAKSYSGQMGQMITSAVTAVGAMALGGAALGAAFVGRRTIGSFMKGSATGETSVQRFARGDSKGTWDRIKGGLFHYGTFGLANSAQVAMGRRINHDKHNVHEISEGRHLLDETAGKMFHGEKYDNLGVDERQQVRNRMDHNTIIRNRENVINPTTGLPIIWGNRKDWAEMTDDERRGIQDHHDTRLAGTTRQARRTGGTETFAETQETNARRKQSLGSTLLQSSATGSYDVRNLSKVIGKEFQSGITKMGIGIISTIALGMRMGLKQGVGVNHGVGQGDFFKDLGNTITEALKNIKIEVPKGGGGGHDDGHDDGHGGHGGGGGGHH